jgi:hypothetical protein
VNIPVAKGIKKNLKKMAFGSSYLPVLILVVS